MIVTEAIADLVVSAWLVTVTVSDPVFEGAVYKPACVIVPLTVFHVTFVLALPVTVAVN